MTPASIGGGNKTVSVAGVNPPLRYTLREDAQGFVSVLCQLTLTRIPRQVSRARLEFTNICLGKYEIILLAKEYFFLM